MLPTVLVAASFAALLFLLPYAAGYGAYRRTLFNWMWTYWQDATWQHGALAIPCAAFLVWRQRRSLRNLPAASSTMGLALTVFGMALYWAGYRGSLFYLGFASIQVLVFGAVLWIWGWECLKSISFAWFILGFAWPYVILEDTVGFQLRCLMVSSTSWLLNHGGIATVQDGTRLLSAAVDGHALGQRFDLNVDAPCSGLRSLFALMMVSALYGYFRQRNFWRRTLLFMLSVPLAILANMLRIVMLIISAMVFGQKFAVGTSDTYTSNYHLLTGITVFLVAFGGLLLAEKLLNRWWGKEAPLPLMEEPKC
jgi:exosortase